MCAVTGAWLSYASPSQACGPCTVPELWGLRELEGAPVVVSNFGLLSKTDSGWLLTCEERIGGLMLDARGDANASLVSTDLGVFAQAGGVCEWEKGPTPAKNDWALSFSLPPVTSGRASESFALVIDRNTQELQVERSRDNEDYTVVHTFGNVSGYRDLVAGGDPAAVFVTGYTFNPRVWHVAYSLDSGQTWGEASPDVDNDYSTMKPRLVDPKAPEALLFQAETVVGSGHEIWRFDATDESSKLLLKMDEGEIYGGMTLNGDSIWVAGRDREGGTLYRARRADLEFEKVVEDAPPLSCLDAYDGALYGCVNDFSRVSNFVLGRSKDGGKCWEPQLTLADLGSLDSCGEDCSTTMTWLQETFGVSEPEGGTGQDASHKSETNICGPWRASGGGWQCSVSQSRGASSLGWLGLAALAWFYRRRRRALLVGRFWTAVLAVLGSVGCSNDSAGASGPDVGGQAGASGAEGGHDADCRTRGADLSHLELETKGGLAVRFLEYSPDPPAVGNNSWLIEIDDESGDPVTGLEDSILVTPFMPEHGHGTPVSVGIEEEDDGQYRLSPVNTFMPGLWQITLEIDAGSATDMVEFEVCVE